MQLVVTMRMDTAAFFDIDGSRDGMEPARILHRLAEDIEATGITGGETGVLHDHNGNLVGSWRATADRDGGDT